MTRTPANVCVLIPAFNAEDTVGRAVLSALAQPEAAEVLLLDDASTDRTLESASAANDGTNRLRCHVLERNQGPAAARNRGIELTKQPWIAVLDADDYFLPGRLTQLLASAEEADFVADDLFVTKAEGDPRRYSRLIGPNLRLPRRLELSDFIRGNMSRPDAPRRELGFLKPLIRTSFLRRHNMRYDERLRLGEDFILYARALAAGARFKLVEPCGYVAVEGPNSLSVSHGVPELEQLLRAARDLSRLPMSREERSCAKAHERQVRQKLQLRKVLQVRRAAGMLPAILKTAAAPSTAPYVLREGVRGAVARRSPRPAVSHPIRNGGRHVTYTLRRAGFVFWRWEVEVNGCRHKLGFTLGKGAARWAARSRIRGLRSAEANRSTPALSVASPTA